MAELVTAVASAVAISKDVKIGFSSTSKAIIYEKDLDKNYEKLDEAVGNLHAKIADLKHKLDGDKTKQPTKQCKKWISSAKITAKEVQKLEEDYRQHKPNLRSLFDRSKLNKSMVEKRKEIQSLLESVPIAELMDRVPMHAINYETPKIEDKQSLYHVFKQILEFLKDKNVRRIGLWGAVGIGKTTIMKNLNESKEIDAMFDKVIFVTMTEEGNVEKLQREIAQQLGLKAEGIISTTIVRRISKELECKRYLLLLDDVQASFELSKIGIFDNGKDSKVVVASRNSDACRSVKIDDIIHLKPLSDEDALKLFRESLGQKISSACIPVAKQVIRECDNIPLLIDRVARTFRELGNDVYQWRTGLKKLKAYPNVKDKHMDDMLKLLEFCFEEIDDEGEKFCFLYGALYPESCEICTDHLLECWRAEGLINDVKELPARDRGKEILRNLINLSLLESSQKIKHIRMNKVIRKMALKLSSESEGSKCLVIVGENRRQAPDAGDWKCRKWISLMDNELCALPEKPHCNNLSTLFLQKNAHLIAIPGQFFGSMENLRVLDLHKTSITTLPSSLSCLKSLRVLYLNSCTELRKLPSAIKELKYLEILDIRGSGVNGLPLEIGYLTWLRSLRISFASFDGKSRNLKNYCKVIQKLSLLEELVVDVLPENQWWNVVVKAIAENVATSTRLTHLSCTIGEFQSTRYKVLDYCEYDICRCLKYANGEGKDITISEFLAETNVFELIGHKDDLALSDFGVNNINKMRSCLIESCNEMRTIINGDGVTHPVLECLEKMYIYNMPNLQSIWKGPIQDGSLSCLTTLVMFRCLKLTSIFPGSLAQQLCQLQHLEVEACHAIEEITMVVDNIHFHPNLEMLILIDLPILRTVSIGDSRELTRTIRGCPLLAGSSG